MFLIGLSMVTDGGKRLSCYEENFHRFFKTLGMYILQLFDNHSATYSALIIGCSEVDLSINQKHHKKSFIFKVTVMAWVYGADQFLEDLKFMLGFYPFPYFFWKWGWKLVSPIIVVVSQQRHNIEM